MKTKTSGALSYSVFYEQAAEGGFVAYVPALPGCHTQGEDLEEAERNVKEAIALYLESLSAHGERIPMGIALMSMDTLRAPGRHPGAAWRRGRPRMGMAP